MNHIQDCTQELIRAILESDEYREFGRIRDKVREQPRLREEINRFRQHVFEVQNSQEPLDMYGEQERLCRDYDAFRRNPLVNDFLQSELRICRLIQQISMEIADSVDLDTDWVEEGVRL